MSGSSGRRHYGYSSLRGRAGMSESEVQGYLRNLLQAYNERDTEAITRHLQVLRDSLELRDDDVIRTLFGGSTSKHTAVNGLSDVDVLVIINDSSLSGRSPREAIQVMADRIRQRLPQTSVTPGDMAVTVQYSDGIEIQVLPAIRTKSGVRVADPGTNRWSNVVRPERFAHKLTRVNQANRGEVIPTVKLVKGMTAHMIRSDRDKISGYHLESLAIEAFRNYRGPHDLRSMVSHYVSYSSKAVRQPITDPTGQSRHVDEYMGPADSKQRQRASKTFRTMRRRLDECKTKEDFDNLLGA